MFKLALSPTFWAPVKMEYTDENGRQTVGTFEAQFKRHDQAQLDMLRERLKEQATDEAVFNFTAEFLREVVTGFRKIEIADGETTIAAEDTQGILDYLTAKNMLAPLHQSFVDHAPKARGKN